LVSPAGQVFRETPVHGVLLSPVSSKADRPGCGNEG
jgi:hypothetical protein